MRAVVQRVNGAQVTVGEEVTGRIERGLLILIAFHQSDSEANIPWMAEKLVNLRIFEDDAGKMNRSLIDVEGSLLVVSQFTLYGDCSKGRRPSFIDSARPEVAEPLYLKFIEYLKRFALTVATGRFGADMQVKLINDGPVTLIIDSPDNR